MVQAHPKLRLGINIDHVATLRNARGGMHPDPLRAAFLVAEAGADSITLHLREDRRHIRDQDVEKIRHEVDVPMNLEMAATEEMLKIALLVRPHAVCIVPERRQELTTEGGLDVLAAQSVLKDIIPALKEKNIRVSLFVNADMQQLQAAKQCGTDAVEIHTGRYCELHGEAQFAELQKIRSAAVQVVKLGMECHAGHGLTYANVRPIAAIREVVELNIGHFLMGEALFVGLKDAIDHMRLLMDEARVA